ncbi:MAG: quinoprotein relay system zinc metallohydrolase 2 [Gammaproteobacteria bacterium]|nr:quinoprotein relay system zinc metallohydrolase 2 [Gammaproteobacteria bacterium]MDE0511281.1 quinoprotein relay system zinc metallohydrolase 2 [Gammaproteobacteria bacterium]
MPADYSLLKSIVITSVTCLLSAIISGAHASEEQDDGFNLTEVSEGIYVHQGKHVDLDHADHDDIANIGFIIGDKCIAVIDTGGSITVGLALKNAIKSKSSLSVCYVINTHIHFDHVLGNIAFTEYGPEFVGHENLGQEMEHNRSFFLSEFAADLGDDPSEDTIIGPDIAVSDKLDLDLGNRLITLSAHPPSHSFTDLSIYDHKTGTLWLSDLLFIDRIPVFDASLKGWLKTMEILKTQQANHVIPGHGTITLPWPDAANAQDNYLNMLLRETRKEIGKGTFMEEVIEIVGKTEKTEWLLHEQNHGRNVSRAFLELEWE